MIEAAYINRMASIHPDEQNNEQQYLKALEPDYKEVIKNPSLRRRMSRVVKMGVACGLECIGHTPKEEIQAIITATGFGCLADTEKFLNNLLDNNEQLLTPTAFIQSTFNTVGAQIALLCGNQAYNMTYVHRGFSFESALLDGLLRLSEGDRHVLIGAFDEVTETSAAIQQRLGLLKQHPAGEGAQFFLLGKQRVEESIACIYPPYTFVDKQKNGSTEILAEKIEEYLSMNSLKSEDIVKFNTPKGICGEYPTSSAFGVFMTAKKLSCNRGNANHILIHSNYNYHHSLILLRKP